MKPARPAGHALVALERLRDRFDARATEEKSQALARLARSRLSSAAAVQRLHEMLCFMRAYPDNPRLLAQVVRMLEAFASRRDLRTHRGALVNSGIVGTDVWYPFFWPTARWLASRCPKNLELDRDDSIAGERLADALPLLIDPPESAWLREAKPAGFDAVASLAGPRTTDAAFLLTRIDAMPGDTLTRERFHDGIEPSYVLHGERATPNRTLAHHRVGPVVFQRASLQRPRPSLREEIQRAPQRVRRVSEREGTALVDLARTAMVSRERDLDAFAYGDGRDVRIVEDGAGLAFMVNGVVPERRTLLPAIFGALTLRNNVPIGYIQADVLDRTAALSFNTFPTFRGGEAAYTFARLLAALKHLFGVTSFSIEPYQLGQDNKEGIESGAWWFYYKLGFRPRARAAVGLVARELARMRKRPGYRSIEATLRELAQWHLFIDLDPGYSVGLPPLAKIGREVARMKARLGATRADACVERALEITGLASLAGFSRDEREAWQRWSPMIALRPQIARWSCSERRAVADIIRAKGARSEDRFVRLFAAHPRFARMLLGKF